MNSETNNLLNSANKSNYSSVPEPEDYGYVSDGRSVSSTDTCTNRFRLMSPDYENPEDQYEEIIGTTSMSEEIRVIFSSSVPLTLTFFMEYAMTVSSLFIIGHFGLPENLASASLAVMTFNITGLAVIEGMATSLDTFCPQAYGAQKFSKVGLYFLRCTMMTFVTSLPIVLLWWCSKSWLVYVIPEHDLLDEVQLFLRILSFGIPGLIFFETGKRFVQAQGFYEASTWALAITVPLNIGLSIYLTKSFGFCGAPTAIALTYWIMALILLLYCLFMEPSTLQCWYPINASRFHVKRVFSNWGPMCKLAIPGLMMIESEYLSFEVLTIMSTHFGVEAIAAQSVIANLGSLIYQIPFAMGCVVSTRVAHYIGMERLASAAIAVKASYLVGASAGIFNFTVLILGNKWLARLFTNDEVVIELAHQVAPILAVNQLYDAITTFSAAILRGQGRQAVGGISNIIAYYVIALPLSGWFAFGPLHLEIKGLWYGCGIGIFLLALTLTFFVYRSNWTKILEDFLAREENEYEVDLSSIDTNEL